MSSFAEWPGRWRHRRCSVLVGFNAFLGANDGIIWNFFIKKCTVLMVLGATIFIGLVVNCKVVSDGICVVIESY
jgi:hypothetical protein